MRRLLPILMMLVVCLTAGGSPNPYGLSDECYKLFLKADSLIDGCSFEDTDNGWIAIGKNGNSIFIPHQATVSHEDSNTIRPAWIEYQLLRVWLVNK